MKTKSIVSRILLSFLMGSSSLALHASFKFENLNEAQLIKSFHPGKTSVDKTDDLSFSPSRKSLQDHKLQISVRNLKKSDFEKSGLAKFDVDEVHKKISEKDRVFFSRSMTVFPGVRPESFSVETHTNPNFIKRVTQPIEIFPSKGTAIHLRKKAGPEQMKVRVRHQDFNLLTKEATHMQEELQRKLVDLAPLGQDNLVMIFSSYSREDDTEILDKNLNFSGKRGTYGGRSIYYAYKLGEKSTLLVTIKFATLKKDDISSKYWGLLTSKMSHNAHRKSARKSNDRKQSYFYDVELSAQSED